MGVSSWDGAQHTYGDLAAIPSSVGGTGGAVPDPNLDAGPSAFFEGIAIFDTRFIYLKDKVQGYTGVVPMLGDGSTLNLTNQIPAAASTTGIATAAAVNSGTAMVLATAQATGISPGIPLIPFSAALNTGTVTTGLALDFGFAFGNVTSGNKTISVSNSAAFVVGLPIIIGGVGNSAGTAALATIVLSIASATTITVQDSPLATNATAPIGTGNYWGPSENGFPTPTAALPYWAKGPALVLDQRQAIARGVSVTATNALAAGGAFTVRGWDIYNQPMSETLTHAGGATTIFGNKAFKYILSVTPAFTDAQTYSVGTSDVFGFNMKISHVEQTTVWYGAAQNTSDQAFVAGVETSPATATTGDVRGTMQFSPNGPLVGIQGNASNGTIVSLAMSGFRLWMAGTMRGIQQVSATQADPTPMFGVTQA